MGQNSEELAPAACQRCARGKGPFVDFVVVKGRFARSCCNCHYSSQGLSCSFRDIESVSTGSTPDGPNANIETLDEQKEPTKMASSGSGPSAFLAGPQASQSEHKCVSTQVNSKEDVKKDRPHSAETLPLQA